jgi:hypothetical protein
MTDSETTKMQKKSTLDELRYMLDKLTPENLNKIYYQDLRHTRNALRKTLREAGIN